MRLKLSLLAASGLLAVSACGVYQDYPNDSAAIEPHRASHASYYQENRASSHHPTHARYRQHHMHDGHYHHDHAAYGHSHAAHHDNTTGDVVVGQDKNSYMRQNEDKWMYKSCPPGAARRGDC